MSSKNTNSQSDYDSESEIGCTFCDSLIDECECGPCDICDKLGSLCTCDDVYELSENENKDITECKKCLLPLYPIEFDGRQTCDCVKNPNSECWNCDSLKKDCICQCEKCFLPLHEHLYDLRASCLCIKVDKLHPDVLNRYK